MGQVSDFPASPDRQKAQTYFQVGIECLGLSWKLCFPLNFFFLQHTCYLHQAYIHLFCLLLLNAGKCVGRVLKTYRSLLTPSGETLDDLSSVEEVNLKEGDALSAVCRRGQLFSGPEALAPWQSEIIH